MNQIVIAPQWYGAYKKGPEVGALRLAELFEMGGLSEQTLISVPNVGSGEDHCMPFFDAIDKVNSNICDAVFSALSSGNKVITIGGDHAISWGSISGVLKHNPEVGVIYLDAHGDCNISERSASHHIHGMHMAYLMGFGEDKYVGRYTKNLLPVENILYVGARSLDPYEVELIKEQGISRITCDVINSDMIQVLDTISDFMSRFKQIHVSLDIDVLDPSIAPGTGVPEVGGITEEALHEVLDFILTKSDQVKSLDLVEYNPLLDIEERTDRVVQKLVKTISSL
ncbi:arginase family protein [Phocaeicola plebeius]|uniref:arginase family protein n=1 Tax=Phocaeicola plebeius TaxID=310297 RepID=UPI003AF74D85